MFSLKAIYATSQPLKFGTLPHYAIDELEVSR